MTREWLAQAVCLALVSTTACSQENDEVSIDTNAPAEERSSDPADVEPAELPPMIERSPAYRCDDGHALYVDVLTDEKSVMVRDTRADIPLRLKRSAADEPFAGSQRTLSGTGAEVRYSTPERPDQTCRQAEI